MNIENNLSNNKKVITKDASLLKFDSRFDQDSKPVLNKYIIKPEITKIQNSNFLSKDKLDFLEQFKQSTNELLQDVNKQKQVNIEDNNKNSKYDKQIKFDLKIGVLDLLDNKSHTTIASSNFDINNIIGKKDNDEVIENLLNQDDMFKIFKERQDESEEDE
jgi:hypothetical protein